LYENFAQWRPECDNNMMNINRLFLEELDPDMFEFFNLLENFELPNKSRPSVASTP